MSWTASLERDLAIPVPYPRIRLWKLRLGRKWIGKPGYEINFVWGEPEGSEWGLQFTILDEANLSREALKALVAPFRNGE